MKKKISANKIDKDFDENKDVLKYFDSETIDHPNQSKRINLELPQWMLQKLDIEAARLGIPRQAIIKFILDEKFKKGA